MKLPLSITKDRVVPVVPSSEFEIVEDADGKRIWDATDNEIDSELIKELVAYANAYHKVKQVVDKYRSAATPVTASYRDAQICGRFQDVLDIVDQVDPK
jgi:hypothetical protein